MSPLPSVQRELLVEVLASLDVYASCSAVDLCTTWARVEALVELRDRGLVRVEGHVLELTGDGYELAEAIAPHTKPLVLERAHATLVTAADFRPIPGARCTTCGKDAPLFRDSCFGCFSSWKHTHTAELLEASVALVQGRAS